MSQVDLNRIGPVHLKTDLDLMKAKRKDLETEIPKQQIMDKQYEHCLVNLMFHADRTIMRFKNNSFSPRIM